jgi:hypothetical protein
MPEALKGPQWLCWRLFLEGKATMAELSTTMSIDDVDLANIALDYWFDVNHPKKGG